MVTAPSAPPLSFGKYERGQELGSGSFSRVFECWQRGRSSRESYAVKVVNLRGLRLSTNSTSELKKLRREVDILKTLPPHDNVVQMVDALDEENWFFLVLELVSGGDLFNVLVSRPGPRPHFGAREAAYILRQLVDGLMFLHGQGIIHRDLKLENVLVASSTRRGSNIFYNIKITDFGLSKAIGSGLSEAYSAVGTKRYVAPEVLQGAAYDFRVDLWSLGVLLYLLLDGRYPTDTPARSEQGALDDAVARLKSASEAARGIVSGLMRIEARRRLSLAELKEHPWLQLPESTDYDDSDRDRPDGRDSVLSADSAYLRNTSSLFGSRESSVFGDMNFPPGAPAPSLSFAASVVAVPAGPGVPSQSPSIRMDSRLHDLLDAGFAGKSRSFLRSEKSMDRGGDRDVAAVNALPPPERAAEPENRTVTGINPPPPPERPAETTENRVVTAINFGHVRPASADPQEVQLHFIVPDRLAGVILGKGGENMKNVANTVGCKIAMTARDGQADRHAIFTGQFPPCFAGQKLMHEHLNEALRQQGQQLLEIVVIFCVRKDLAGLVIGKNGSVLKNIVDQSKARVNFSRQEVESQRPCTIIGPPDCVLEAEKCIHELLKNAPAPPAPVVVVHASTTSPLLPPASSAAASVAEASAATGSRRGIAPGADAVESVPPSTRKGSFGERQSGGNSDGERLDRLQHQPGTHSARHVLANSGGHGEHPSVHEERRPFPSERHVERQERHGERPDRAERQGERQDRHGDRAERQERPSERQERPSERQDRLSDRQGERQDRFGERADRHADRQSDRQDRPPADRLLERSERYVDRQERVGDRLPERGDRHFERQDRMGDRPERSSRQLDRHDRLGDRPERTERPPLERDRPGDRPERSDRQLDRQERLGDRPERGERQHDRQDRLGERPERIDRQLDRQDRLGDRSDRADRQVDRQDRLGDRGERPERHLDRQDRLGDRAERTDRQLDRQDRLSDRPGRSERQPERPERLGDRPERPERQIDRQDRLGDRPERADRYVDRQDRLGDRPERSERPLERLERHGDRPERSERYPERKERHTDRLDRHTERPDRRDERPAERHADRHVDRHGERHDRYEERSDRNNIERLDRHGERSQRQSAASHSERSAVQADRDRYSERYGGPSDRHLERRSGSEDRHTSHGDRHADRFYGDRHSDKPSSQSDRHSDRRPSQSDRYAERHAGPIDRHSDRPLPGSDRDSERHGAGDRPAERTSAPSTTERQRERPSGQISAYVDRPRSASGHASEEERRRPRSRSAYVDRPRSASGHAEDSSRRPRSRSRSRSELRRHPERYAPSLNDQRLDSLEGGRPVPKAQVPTPSQQVPTPSQVPTPKQVATPSQVPTPSQAPAPSQGVPTPSQVPPKASQAVPTPSQAAGIQATMAGQGERHKPSAGDAAATGREKAEQGPAGQPQPPQAGPAGQPPKKKQRRNKAGGGNSSDLTEMTKLLVPTTAAGLVIGKQGAGLKQLKDTHGVRLEVLRDDQVPCWPGDRVVTIKGPTEARMSAVDAVLRAVHPAAAKEEQPINLKLLVPSSKAGVLIGKQGIWLKNIREKSGIPVTVDREDKMGERLVSATGQFTQVATVVEGILQTMDNTGEKPRPVDAALGIPPPPTGPPLEFALPTAPPPAV
eukprot:TRINITY_DN8326_c0_g1_i1.p1 TRINITY_DN8326_c0_g1~~TRINITY_DN8326_c0_g1_i1.p1  ORF type:complete len:1646 (-),score=269.33 TRINITY_DN8326_c0_g1_i1:76-5013(-)